MFYVFWIFLRSSKQGFMLSVSFRFIIHPEEKDLESILSRTRQIKTFRSQSSIKCFARSFFPVHWYNEFRFRYISVWTPLFNVMWNLQIAKKARIWIRILAKYRAWSNIYSNGFTENKYENLGKWGETNLCGACSRYSWR